jgi:DNA-directed RNA polymerase specialized sigma24 family protein
MSSGDDSVTGWLNALKSGDSQAAGEIWNRYYARLAAVARRRLGSMPRRMTDEEDVALSAMNHFFQGVEDGRFTKLDDRDDLWQVLVMLVSRRAATHQEKGLRQKRGGGAVRGESVWANESVVNGIDAVAGDATPPDMAAELAESCQALLTALPEGDLREIAVAKLDGFTNDEIAGRMGVQTRTVERKLRTIRELWSHDSLE